MKIRYDPEVDALSIRFSAAEIVESEELSNGVILDFDCEGRIVSIEVLDASKHIAAGATFST